MGIRILNATRIASPHSAAQQRVQGGRLRGNELSVMKRSRVLDITGYPAAVWTPPRDATSAVMYAHEA
eukprot:4062507-Prymnesium_polylepis.1